MSFILSSNFEIDRSKLSHLAKPEFDTKRLKIEIVGIDVVRFFVTERGLLSGNVIMTEVFSTSWKFRERKSDESAWFENASKRRVDLEHGDIFKDAIEAMHSGDIVGRAAGKVATRIFRFLEIENVPDGSSWVEQYFPAYFRDERNRFGRKNKKIVKRVLEI